MREGKVDWRGYRPITADAIESAIAEVRAEYGPFTIWFNYPEGMVAGWDVDLPEGSQIDEREVWQALRRAFTKHGVH